MGRCTSLRHSRSASQNQNRREPVCISGLVTLDPGQLIGAVTGLVRPLLSDPIRIRQVVGPAGGPVSLTTVNGRFATVCGAFVEEQGQVLLDVRQVIPGSPVAPVLPLLLLLPLLTLALVGVREPG